MATADPSPAPEQLGRRELHVLDWWAGLTPYRRREPSAVRRVTELAHGTRAPGRVFARLVAGTVTDDHPLYEPLLLELLSSDSADAEAVGTFVAALGGRYDRLLARRPLYADEGRAVLGARALYARPDARGLLRALWQHHLHGGPGARTGLAPVVAGAVPPEMADACVRGLVLDDPTAPWPLEGLVGAPTTRDPVAVMEHLAARADGVRVEPGTAAKLMHHAQRDVRVAALSLLGAQHGVAGPAPAPGTRRPGVG